MQVVIIRKQAPARPDPIYLGRCTILNEDCLVAMRAMPENSIDSIVTDPPYHLTTGKKGGSGEASVNLDSPYGRARITTGFMGKEWDGGDLAHTVELWQEALRVLKPGGHLAAFGGTRTYHRLACAIEDAGFEIRDMIAWLYGQGFPKSLDVSKAIDASRAGKVYREQKTYLRERFLASGLTEAEVMTRLGFEAESRNLYNWMSPTIMRIPSWASWQGLKEIIGLDARFDDYLIAIDREVIGATTAGIHNPEDEERATIGASSPVKVDVTAPTSPEAKQWEGWGTALKPAIEPICLARKPLSEGTVAANVLRWGTGALNIDATRIAGETPSADMRAGGVAPSSCKPGTYKATIGNRSTPERWLENRPGEELGRWPANVVHDGSEEVTEGFPDSVSSGGKGEASRKAAFSGHIYGDFAGTDLGANAGGLGDSGSASRFFYCAKARTSERRGSQHPTVKPVALMDWLTRLITPPRGIVLDPFAGTGTTGVAARDAGFRAILIERETEYILDIRRRLVAMREK